MFNGLHPQQQNFLLHLARTQARAAAAQQQITSGLRVRTASDDPAAVERLLRTQTDLAAIEQTKVNLNTVKVEVETASGAMQNAIRIMDEALTIGSQATSGSFGNEKRSILSRQIAELQARMVNLSATTSNGRYVFSGDLDGAPSYALNYESPNGVDQLATPSATLQVAGPDGARILIGRTAQELFDARQLNGEFAPENVFAALQKLRLAVDSGNNQEMVSAMGLVKSATAHLNTQAAGYGSTLSRLTGAINDSEAAQARWKVTLSEIRDADIASAILTMQQTETQLNASMAAQAQFPRTSLFDFLR